MTQVMNSLPIYPQCVPGRGPLLDGGLAVVVQPVSQAHPVAATTNTDTAAARVIDVDVVKVVEVKVVVHRLLRVLFTLLLHCVTTIVKLLMHLDWL